MSRPAAYHPACFMAADAPADGSPTRGKPIEVLHAEWPDGRACAGCGGTTAEVRP